MGGGLRARGEVGQVRVYDCDGRAVVARVCKEGEGGRHCLCFKGTRVSAGCGERFDGELGGWGWWGEGRRRRGKRKGGKKEEGCAKEKGRRNRQISKNDIQKREIDELVRTTEDASANDED